ncbi:MAG: N5-glutamine methyltransferase family protein, partial [bacterium]
VECTLKFAGSADKIFDLCTGSGNIVISLAKELPSASFCASDVSAQAVKLAEENASRHGVQQRISFLCGNLFEPAKGQEKSFDLIVCNPPYIPTDQIKKLQPEIKDFEPRLAVDGGKDGLSFYRRLIPEAASFLKSPGSLIMEIGENQAMPVRDMMKDCGYQEITVFKDYGRMDRVMAGRLP